MNELYNESGWLFGLRLVGVFLINPYILKYFLNLSFKTALYRKLQQSINSIFYYVSIIMPLVALILFIKFMCPDLFLTYKAMNNLFSVNNFSTIWNEGLSGEQLIWGLGFVSAKIIELYISYYISCYVYEHHIDASVDKIKLKKAMLSIIVIDQISWLTISIGKFFLVN